jgi:hypothetical protein
MEASGSCKIQEKLILFMYDVAIIGAGPAGATLARLIGNQYKVLLIEKRRLPDQSDGFSAIKCCGGLLAPDAQMMLSKLGLGLPKSVLEDPQLFVVKSMDLRQGLERYYQRHYINMNRKKFDSWLLSLVPPGVDIRTNFSNSLLSMKKEILLKKQKSSSVQTERNQKFARSPLPSTFIRKSMSPSRSGLKGKMIFLTSLQYLIATLRIIIAGPFQRETTF